MEWYGLMLGAVGGLFGTLVMSAIEVIPWRKWGLPGVFEWHEYQMLTVKFLKLEYDDACLHYLGIFGLHLTNGVLGGIGFYFAIEFIDFLALLPLPLLEIVYGFFLWIVTLGHGPALASLAGHFAYGIVISLLFLGFI